MNKFIRKTLLVVGPFLLIILVVNIYVDSAFLFRRKVRSEEIASLLVAGNNVGIKQIPNDWGDLQISIVEELKKKQEAQNKDILVFGASRSSEINSSLFPNHSFFNCVVPGGSIVDFIALYGLYKKSDLLPKYVIISVDFSTFYAKKSLVVNGNLEYLADTINPIPVSPVFLKQYKNGIKYIGEQESEGKRLEHSIPEFDLFKLGTTFLELFNIDYFQLNLQSSRENQVVTTSEDTLSSYFVIRKDGGYSLAQQSKIDKDYVLKLSERFVNVHKKSAFRENDFKTIYFEYFKKMLLSLKKDGVTPIVYISPINPYVFDKLLPAQKAPLEESIDKFCIEKNILRIGSFNPHKYGYHLVDNYFSDAYHPVKSVVDTIFHFHQNELSEIGIVVRR